MRRTSKGTDDYRRALKDPSRIYRPGDFHDARLEKLSSRRFFDTPPSFCQTEISKQEVHYGKEANQGYEACRQKGLGQTQEVHDFHVPQLQKANKKRSTIRRISNLQGLDRSRTN